MTFESAERIAETRDSRGGDVARTPARRRPALSGRSLSILADLGMTDAQIARYFRVPETRVVSLRRYYGVQ